ncbi:NADPH-dependent FMN reductase [Seonamhaeicola aphaedonensis]|uniref:NAD(P)H-dependent FMN reductase n=1 Tax=Seonamhaeicola aphaedonensis TaxID=1461338 RepID=A0A3D9HIU3_9FLAO|nr:NADPH-dependent FMN reductase [Seonamhaeicola aphaedonensis]RED49442.1 NAD(P)H-dependent FMN reductase [Seonamhaeicola aphaedonensis]
MKKVIALAGSNSKKSINKQLAIYTANLIDDVKTNILDLNDFDIPIYSIDYENEHGIPDKAYKFLSLVKEADGVILSLAEHNGAYTTAFKNIFDWVSRIEGSFWSEKPMLLMATSPGGRGGASVLSIAQDRFPRHAANITGVFSLPSFGTNFSEGKISNKDLDDELKEHVKNFKGVL